MPTTITDQNYGTLVDNAARPAPLSAYRLWGSSGSVVMTGFFVDMGGMMVGFPFTYTIPAPASDNGWITFDTVAGSANGSLIPGGAVGVIFDISGDLKYTAISPVADIPAISTMLMGYCPTLEQGKNLTLGRVA